MSEVVVRITGALGSFVEAEVAAGAYASADEVVRTGVLHLKRQADRRARKLERLNAAIQVGQDQIDRGEVIEIDDLTAFFDELVAEIDADLASRPV